MKLQVPSRRSRWPSLPTSDFTLHPFGERLPCGLPPPAFRGDRLCETKPIPGRQARAWETGAAGSCTNKPNLHPSAVRGKSFMDNELWLIKHAPAFRETKPIPGGAGWVRTWRTWGVGVVAQNKANPGGAGWDKGPGGRGTWHVYKQSQFGQAGFPTIPLFHPSNILLLRPVYKQSQFCYLGPVTERLSCDRSVLA